MIYDLNSLNKIAVKAGIKDVERLSKKFIPTLFLPVFLININLLLAFLFLILLLRLPYLYLWYLSKQRHKKIRQQLPLFISSLKWMLSIHPIQKALCIVKFGEVSKIFKIFCVNYNKGEDFQKAIKKCAIFPELEELIKRLIVIYNTGSGEELLNLYADKVSSENLTRARKLSARMEIFAVAYTTVAAIIPAMYSGLTMNAGGSNAIYLGALASLLLVILWKVVE